MSWRLYGHIINREREPLWRWNARNDADRHRDYLFKGECNRRAFVGGGAALLLEYRAMRKAVASPLFHPGSGSNTIHILANPTVPYQFIPDALMAMSNGDTLILPAGLTYDWGGQTMYYSHYKNLNPRATYSTRNVFLGHTAGYSSTSTADHGTIQGVGTANNGRPLLAAPWGALASDFHTTDTTMAIDSAYPVSNFNPGPWNIYVQLSNETFAFTTMSYTGIDVPSNSLTGVTGNTTGTILAGAIITSFVGDGGQALFIAAGQNPGWTFNNLELAYGGGGACALQQQSSIPGGPYVGSMTLNNCFIHECSQGPGLGFEGVGSQGIFNYFYNSEIYQNGSWTNQTHNVYVDHITEAIFDNCYSHYTLGAWLFKSKANMNLIWYNQVRGERTDSNPGGDEGSGIDLPVAGLNYIIGNIHQSSLNAANVQVHIDAESNVETFYGSAEAGSCNPIQETYVVNGTHIAPTSGSGSAGAGLAPGSIWAIRPHRPYLTKLSQAAGGSLPARQYWVGSTNNGATSGETDIVPNLGGYLGTGFLYNTLSVSASNLLSMASPEQYTGCSGWNCYMSYPDPPLFGTATPPFTGNNYWWDSGHTQPVFSTGAGGTTISITGTLNSGNNVITSTSGLTGIASIAQLTGMAVYANGTFLSDCVSSVDTTTGNITLFNNSATTYTAATFTFGYYLACGFSYQTAIGDSVNLANAITPGNVFFYDNRTYGQQDNGWVDGSYAAQTSSNFIVGAYILVPPGQKLTVNAPPAAPSWNSISGVNVTGINFWAQRAGWFTGSAAGPSIISWDDPFGGDFPNMGSASLSRQNPTVIGFNSSWTSPASVFSKAGQFGINVYKQNSTPLTIGTPFTEGGGVLVNNNSLQSKLQWYRRAGVNINGGTMDCWYAVVPIGGLSSYTETINAVNSLNQPPAALNGSVSIWRNCLTNPFDTFFPVPVVNNNNSATISTALANITVLAAFRSAGTAGAGFTQISTSGLMNASYVTATSPLSGQTVTETGGSSSDPMVVDVLAGAGSPPTFVSSVNISGSSSSVTFTIASANAGDVLYLMIGEDNGANMWAIGKNAALYNNAVGVAPQVTFQNALTANFSTSTSDLAFVGETGGTVPGANLIQTTNLKANGWTGSSYTTPLWATVFNDPTQSDFNYALASGSPAIGAGTIPGTVHGQSLIPVSQSSWSGSRTPGTPIPPLNTRSDNGLDQGALS